MGRLACVAIFFCVFVFVPLISHAQVTCTGLGDNKITLGGDGRVSVACSKYETPGGGATQFQMPDGTMCAFENLNSSKVACGSSPGGGGKTPPKLLSQNEFGMLVKSVQDAFKGGSTHSEIVELIHDSLLGKQAITNGDIFTQVFNAPLGEAETVETTADRVESVYGALLSLTQPFEGSPAQNSDGQQSPPALLAVISDTRQWVLTDRPLAEVLGQKKRLAYPQGLSLFVSPMSDFSAGQSLKESSPCDIACALRKAWYRGAISWFDVLFPIASAALAGLFTAYTRRFTTRE